MRLRSLSLIACCAAAAAGEAGARVQIEPSLDLRQVTDLGLGEDELTTYTEVVAGIDVRIETRRIRATVDYNYGRRIAEEGVLANDERHTGLIRGNVDVVPRALSIEFGGLAALVNRDLGLSQRFSTDANDPNLVQTFTAFLEPRLHRRLGDLAEVDLSYRVGVYEVESGRRRSGGAVSSPDDSSPNVPSSDSINQRFLLTFGNRERSRRLRWDLVADINVEDVDRLDQHYRAYAGRAEVEYRFTKSLGFVANGGYEDILNTESAVLLTPEGVPVVGPNGEVIPDPASPRQVLFRETGSTYELGLVWVPSRRLSVDARYGHRYGDALIDVRARWRPTPRLGIDLTFGDRIDSFGRLLTQNIAGVPISFAVGQNEVIGNNGCVFGVDPTTGTCLGGATQSITNAQFRNRSGQMIVSGQRRGLRYLASVVYGQREFLNAASLQTPGAPPIDPTIAGRRDSTLALTVTLDQRLGDSSSARLALFNNRYAFALSNDRIDHYRGATLGWRLRAGRNVSLAAQGTFSRRDSNRTRTTNNAVVAISAALRY